MATAKHVPFEMATQAAYFTVRCSINKSNKHTIQKSLNATFKVLFTISMGVFWNRFCA